MLKDEDIKNKQIALNGMVTVEDYCASKHATSIHQVKSSN